MSTATAFVPHVIAGPSAIGSLRSALRAMANLSGHGSTRPRTSGPAGAMRVTARDGETFAVHACGRGRPVILVHGLGGSHRAWDRLTRHLVASHRVYAWDARGHGARGAGAGADAAPPTLATLSDDLACVIERLAGERPLLVGHSMGALTVIDYLARYGEAAVAGICLIDQSPRIVNDESWRCGLFGSFTEAQHEALIARMKKDFVGAVFDEIAGRLSPSLHAMAAHCCWVGRLVRRLVAGVRTDALISLIESIGACDFRATLAGLSVPTLVVLGGRSHHYGNVPLADYYAGTLRRGTVTTYPSAAHSPHEQAAAALARDLSRFGAVCHASAISST